MAESALASSGMSARLSRRSPGAMGARCGAAVSPAAVGGTTRRFSTRRTSATLAARSSRSWTNSEFPTAPLSRTTRSATLTSTLSPSTSAPRNTTDSTFSAMDASSTGLGRGAGSACARAREWVSGRLGWLFLCVRDAARLGAFALEREAERLGRAFGRERAAGLARVRGGAEGASSAAVPPSSRASDPTTRPANLAGASDSRAAEVTAFVIIGGLPSLEGEVIRSQATSARRCSEKTSQAHSAVFLRLRRRPWRIMAAEGPVTARPALGSGSVGTRGPDSARGTRPARRALSHAAHRESCAGAGSRRPVTASGEVGSTRSARPPRRVGSSPSLEHLARSVVGAASVGLGAAVADRQRLLSSVRGHDAIPGAPAFRPGRPRPRPS